MDSRLFSAIAVLLVSASMWAGPTAAQDPDPPTIQVRCLQDQAGTDRLRGHLLGIVDAIEGGQVPLDDIRPEGGARNYLPVNTDDPECAVTWATLDCFLFAVNGDPTTAPACAAAVDPECALTATVDGDPAPAEPTLPADPTCAAFQFAVFCMVNDATAPLAGDDPNPACEDAAFVDDCAVTAGVDGEPYPAEPTLLLDPSCEDFDQDLFCVINANTARLAGDEPHPLCAEFLLVEDCAVTAGVDGEPYPEDRTLPLDPTCESLDQDLFCVINASTAFLAGDDPHPDCVDSALVSECALTETLDGEPYPPEPTLPADPTCRAVQDSFVCLANSLGFAVPDLTCMDAIIVTECAITSTVDGEPYPAEPTIPVDPACGAFQDQMDCFFASLAAGAPDDTCFDDSKPVNPGCFIDGLLLLPGQLPNPFCFYDEVPEEGQEFTPNAGCYIDYINAQNGGPSGYEPEPYDPAVWCVDEVDENLDHPDTVVAYEQSFEGGDNNNWEVVGGDDPDTFTLPNIGCTSATWCGDEVLGPFRNEEVVFSYSPMTPGYDNMRVTVDVIMLGSWDGTNFQFCGQSVCQPDTLRVFLPGDDDPEFLLHRASFANDGGASPYQSYPAICCATYNPAGTGADEYGTIGIDGGDSVYQFSWDIDPGTPAGELELHFKGGMFGNNDGEGWAIGNIRVESTAGPLPSPS